MSTLWPIFVPSKERPNSSLIALASAQRVPVIAVLEPQDVRDYKLHFPGLDTMVLPENNRGLPFSRATILSHARSRGFNWFWMLDDDIKNFYRVRDRRCVVTPMKDVLLKAQGLPDINVGQLALEYQQFAWSSKVPTKRNSYCDVVVAIRTSVKANYRALFKEDRDFTLQVIASGMDTMRAAQLAFSAPKNGSNRGGLFNAYADGHERLGVEKLVELWPWCCESQTKPSGRFDAKIHWKRVRQQPLTIAPESIAI